jgi:hypothetical protein
VDQNIFGVITYYEMSSVGFLFKYRQNKLLIYFTNITLIMCLQRLLHKPYRNLCKYRGADKSLTRPTSRCIMFDGENISFDSR